ncbi:MAG: MFS transporter [Solirubrobacterales bacterium]
MNNGRLVLVAMVFACAMTFIDQTIVAIAIPDIEKDLGLSDDASQWVVNGYLLALAALFAFGGKLGDVLGRRSMVTVGVIGFTICSVLCGFTPDGSISEAWLIASRVAQGAFAALLFPAAVGIVVAAFSADERGKAMAIFFGVTGGLTAVGPFLGGYLVEWTWRSIFWINVPVAIIALIMIHVSKPDNTKRPQKLDYRGTVLIAGAMGLVVLALQQATEWGWLSAQTIGCIVAGLILGAIFIRRELSIDLPLLQLRIFSDRGFAADNMILALMSIAFVPFFLFASEYAQIALGQSASGAGEYIMYFFIGFVVAAQIGGRMLDSDGAKKPVLIGSVVSAVGFFMLAGRATDLNINDQQWPLIIAGAGVGMILGPASTDALNRAAKTAYSEVTGITQTARNLGASIGLAVLSTILISQTKTNVVDRLGADGVSRTEAISVADSLSSGPGAAPSGASTTSAELVHSVQMAFADSMQVVFYIMAGVMASIYVIAQIWMVSGRAESVEEAAAEQSVDPIVSEPLASG